MTLVEAQDFIDSAPPRPMGLEFELITPDGFEIATGESAHDTGIKIADVDDAGFPCVRHGTHLWLENGMRTHRDGDVWELDSSESLGSKSLAISGEALLQTAAAIANGDKVKAKCGNGTIYYSGGNFSPSPEGVDGAYNVRSVHLNLTTIKRREGWIIDSGDLLAGHYATAVWAGAGMLTPNGFSILQRQDRVGVIVRKHVGMDNDDVVESAYLRLERRIGEASRSTYANFAQYAAASLVARIYEHQDKFTDKENLDFMSHLLKEPVYDLPIIGQDLTFRQRLWCNDGQQRSALQIQQLYIDRVNALIAKGVRLPEDELRGLACWQKLVTLTSGCNLLAGNVLAQLKEPSQYMHWALRARIIALCNKNPNPDNPEEWLSSNPALNNQSLQLERIHPVDAMGRVAVKSAAEIIPDFEAKVQARMRTGDGRGIGRGLVIAALKASPVDHRPIIRWNKIHAGRMPAAVRLDPHDPVPPQEILDYISRVNAGALF